MTWSRSSAHQTTIDHVARQTRIVSASCRWDPAGAKIHSDVSALCLMLQDEAGRMYWHRAVALTGEIAELDDSGKIIGGQVWQICDEIERLSIPRVTIETNGVGTHAPNLLRGALKARRLRAGVADKARQARRTRRFWGRSRGPCRAATCGRMCRCSMRSRNKCEAGTRPCSSSLTTSSMRQPEAILDEPVRVGRKDGWEFAPPRVARLAHKRRGLRSRGCALTCRPACNARRPHADLLRNTDCDHDRQWRDDSFTHSFTVLDKADLAVKTELSGSFRTQSRASITRSPALAHLGSITFASPPANGTR